MALSLKLSCPRHRRYNPASQGEAGIVGGCTYCTKLLRIYNAAQYEWEAARLGANLKERIEQFKKPSPKR